MYLFILNAQLQIQILIGLYYASILYALQFAGPQGIKAQVHSCPNKRLKIFTFTILIFESKLYLFILNAQLQIQILIGLYYASILYALQFAGPQGIKAQVHSCPNKRLKIFT